MNACARADFQPAGGIGRAGRSGQFGGLGRGARGEALAFLAVLDFPAEGGEFVAEFVAGGPLFVFAGGGAGFEEGLNLLGDGGGVGLESEHLVCLAPPIEEGARILRGEGSLVDQAIGLADGVEEMAERAGNIQVVVERIQESGCGAEGMSGSTIFRAGERGEARDPFIDAGERAAGGGEPLEGEIER